MYIWFAHNLLIKNEFLFRYDYIVEIIENTLCLASFSLHKLNYISETAVTFPKCSGNEIYSSRIVIKKWFINLFAFAENFKVSKCINFRNVTGL